MHPKIETMVILAKELAAKDGVNWEDLEDVERNNYYAKASWIPIQ